MHRFDRRSSGVGRPVHRERYVERERHVEHGRQRYDRLAGRRHRNHDGTGD
jgi:hypothetical protein